MQRINADGLSDLAIPRFGAGKPGLDGKGYQPGEKSQPDFWGVDHKYLVTPSDAKRLGIEAPTAPAPVKCEFCGTWLEFWGLRNPLDGSRVTRWMKPMKCTCQKARNFWISKGHKPYEDPFSNKPVQITRTGIDKETLISQGVPAAYAAATADNLPVTEAVKKQILRYLGQQSLLITGSLGNADIRQMIAAAGLKAAQDNQAVTSCEWISEAEIADKDSKVDNVLEKAPLLVIAEIGVCNFTPYSFGRLYYYLESRHGDGRRTIYTTPHKGLKELGLKWAEAGSQEQVERLIEILKLTATII